MIALVIIVAYLIVGLIAGRIVGRSVYKRGSLYSHTGVKAGDVNGAVTYAVWHGLFWPVLIYLIGIGSVIIAIVWVFNNAVPMLARLFIGKKALDQSDDNG